jgi:glycosyltransferase involved in cell wall biosynthesis
VLPLRTFLRHCVEKVLGQSIWHVRILIVDDASPDNTAEVAAGLVREDPRVTFIRDKVNKGHIANYNEGLFEWADAKYSLLLPADDYLLPGALIRAVDLMDANPEVGLTFGNYIELGDDATETQVRRFANATRTSEKVILQGEAFIDLSGADNLVASGTAVVRTQMQKKLGGYGAELPHSGDMEMWLRFAAQLVVGSSTPSREYTPAT